MPKTVLTPAQFSEAAALGGKIAEVRDLAGDGYSFDEIKSILESQREAKTAELSEEALRNAAAERQERENEKNDKPHPQISAYSYPEGDRARPRPQFRCKTYWRDSLLDYDTSTALEIELLNQIEPGAYRLERPDGSPFKVEVIGERDEVSGKWNKINVQFDRGRGLRNSLPSQVAMLRAILDQQVLQSRLVTA